MLSTPINLPIKIESITQNPLIILGIQINNDRLYENQFKIKIPDIYKKRNCFYSILTHWNNCNTDFKMAGNIFSLKQMIKNEFTQSYKPCSIKNCQICELDEERCYETYMSK